MARKFKRLEDQVLVITGASSGLGLALARHAAWRGARVVLASRNEAALKAITEEIRAQGGNALYAVADVSRASDVSRIADTAIGGYGRIDTWINNAGVTLFGETLLADTEDERRVFEVNCWGSVLGCREAVRRMGQAGGVIINIGSFASERSLPLQAAYSASKHALKGYTDTLRLELQRAGLPTSICLLKPGAIDTPFFDHSGNLMDCKAKPAGAPFSPRVIARATLACAERPRRELTVGGSVRVLEIVSHCFPSLTDWGMRRFMFEAQKRPEARIRRRTGNLYQPLRREGREQGEYLGHVKHSSLYAAIVLHPVRATLLSAILGGVFIARLIGGSEKLSAWPAALRGRTPGSLPA